MSRKAKIIREDLMMYSGDQFANALELIFQALLPNISQSRRLGELDRQGIDVLQFDVDSGKVKIAIQCKGWERPPNDSHVAALVKEVAKFSKIGPKVEEYWLVINRSILDPLDRGSVEDKLAELVSSGKAGQAKLLDIDRLLILIESLSETTIAAWAKAFQSELETQYRARLDIVPFLANAPFAAPDELHDPSRFLMDVLDDYLPTLSHSTLGAFRDPPRFLLTGGFGFGKTRTLHATAEAWLNRGRQILYIPAALLSEQAFVHSGEFAADLLNLIKPSDLEISELPLRVLRSTLRRDLKSSNSWLLIIDALDESSYGDSTTHLATLWSILSSLGIPFVISLREEIYILRKAEFVQGDGQKRADDYFRLINLLDWPAELILQFLDQFELRRGGPPSASFERLRSVVAAGDYETVYGDIPKRPLFLGMLAEDAWAGMEPEKQLHKLYGQYFRRKLDMDRWSAGAAGAAVRGGDGLARLGHEEMTERMLLTMQILAGRIAEHAGDDGRLLGGSVPFEEAMLLACLAEAGAGSARAEEVVLNSVIQPAGRDRKSGKRQFRFSHKSFQDWFLARHLVASGGYSRLDGSAPRAVASFAAGMQVDLDEGRPLP